MAQVIVFGFFWAMLVWGAEVSLLGVSSIAGRTGRSLLVHDLSQPIATLSIVADGVLKKVFTNFKITKISYHQKHIFNTYSVGGRRIFRLGASNIVSLSPNNGCIVANHVSVAEGSAPEVADLSSVHVLVLEVMSQLHPLKHILR